MPTVSSLATVCYKYRMEETIYGVEAALLDAWSGHAWSGGVQLECLSELEVLSVRTRNSTYEIAVVSRPTGEVLVRGGRFFPEFVRARLAGSSLGGSFLKVRGIYVGFNLELQLDTGSIITSAVQSIRRVAVTTT